jgi:hypothetical protein
MLQVPLTVNLRQRFFVSRNVDAANLLERQILLPVLGLLLHLRIWLLVIVVADVGFQRGWGCSFRR